MAKTKLSVTVQEDVADRIHQLASLRSQPISRLVETALRQFLAGQLEAEMEEGYRLMASYDRTLAEHDMMAGFETLPDA